MRATSVSKQLAQPNPALNHHAFNAHSATCAAIPGNPLPCVQGQSIVITKANQAAAEDSSGCRAPCLRLLWSLKGISAAKWVRLCCKATRHAMPCHGGDLHPMRLLLRAILHTQCHDAHQRGVPAAHTSRALQDTTATLQAGHLSHQQHCRAARQQGTSSL